MRLLFGVPEAETALSVEIFEVAICTFEHVQVCSPSLCMSLLPILYDTKFNVSDDLQLRIPLD